MPVFIPLLIGVAKWTIGAAVSYGVYRTADEMLMDGKAGDAMASGGEYLVNAGKNTVGGWVSGDDQPQTPLAQSFSQQNGVVNDSAGTAQQQQLESSTSLSLTEQQRQAAAANNTSTSTPEAQEGDGLFETVTKLMTGETNYSVADDIGVAALFGGASKLFGAGNIKAGVIAALATTLWTYREEIIGGFKSAFGKVTEMTGPTNQQSYSNGFVSYNSEGKVFDPKTATSGNSFADLRPL